MNKKDDSFDNDRIAPALFTSIPHSGEEIPPEAPWLNSLPTETLLRDVDRFVDELYIPALKEFGVPYVSSKTHRYALDLNRHESDVDCESVLGNKNPQGTHPRGLHWRVTTFDELLLPRAMSQLTHETLIQKYSRPFHEKIETIYSDFTTAGHSMIFHLDLHSMPSKGTGMHKDPGETRAEVVISDFNEKSAHLSYRKLLVSAFENVGLKVAINWPYIGGGITQRYGAPALGRHCLQIELNRSLYMNEVTKAKKPVEFTELQKKLREVMREVKKELPRVQQQMLHELRGAH